MIELVLVVRVFLRSRADTALDILALRQQVVVLKRKRSRPTLIVEPRPLVGPQI